MLRAHVLKLYYLTLFNLNLNVTLVFNLSTASHAYRAGHDRFFGTQNKYFNEFLSLLLLLWQPTTAHLNHPHIFIFRYMKSFNSVDIFYTDLTLISMETGCQARWRIAVATHVPKALKCYLRRQHSKAERQQGTSESKFSFTSCLRRYLLLNEFWRQHRCIIRCLWYPTKMKRWHMKVAFGGQFVYISMFCNFDVKSSEKLVL